MDEAGLWEAWLQRGDTSARDILAEKHIYLLHRTAGKMKRGFPAHIRVDDLISYGALGFMRALENFDPSMGKSFNSYAVASVRGAILDEIRSIDWAPKSLRKRERDVNRAKSELRASSHREPDVAEVAGHMGVAEDEVRDVTWRVQGATHESLDGLREAQGWDSESSHDTESHVVVSEAQEIFLKWFESQAEEDQVILSLCYYERMTLIDVSRRMRLPEPLVVSRHTALVLDLRNALEEALTGRGV